MLHRFHIRHLSMLTVLSASSMLIAQQDPRGTQQDPMRPTTEPLATATNAEQKFQTFDDVRGATVYLNEQSERSTEAADRRSGTDAAAGEKLGEIVDVMVPRSTTPEPAGAYGGGTDHGTDRGIDRGTDRGIGRDPGRETTRDTSRGEGETSTTGTEYLGTTKPMTDDRGGTAEAVIRVTATGGARPLGGDTRPVGDRAVTDRASDRTVRVPMSMLDWDHENRCFTFDGPRAEFDAMPGIVASESTPIDVERGAEPRPVERGGRELASARQADARSMLRLSQLADATIESTAGQKIGSVEQLVLDIDQGNAAFVLAATDATGRTEQPGTDTGTDKDTDQDTADRGGRATAASGEQLAVIPWRAVQVKMQDRTTGAAAGAKDHCTLTVALEHSEVTDLPKMAATDLDKLIEPKFRMKIHETFGTATAGTRR